jgi:hypothetical protein
MIFTQVRFVSQMWGQYQNFVREELPRLKVHDCMHAVSRQTWRPKEKAKTTVDWLCDSRLYQMAKKRTASLVHRIGDCIAFTSQAAARKKLIADAEAAVTLAYKNLNMSKVLDAAQGNARVQSVQRWGIPVSRLLNLRMEESGAQGSITVRHEFVCFQSPGKCRRLSIWLSLCVSQGVVERAGGNPLKESGASGTVPLHCPISSVSRSIVLHRKWFLAD